MALKREAIHQGPANNWFISSGVEMKKIFIGLRGTEETGSSKLPYKIVQARPQQYVNQELPDVLAGFRKGRGTRDPIANICWYKINTYSL